MTPYLSRQHPVGRTEAGGQGSEALILRAPHARL